MIVYPSKKTRNSSCFVAKKENYQKKLCQNSLNIQVKFMLQETQFVIFTNILLYVNYTDNFCFFWNQRTNTSISVALKSSWRTDCKADIAVCKDKHRNLDQLIRKQWSTGFFFVTAKRCLNKPRINLLLNQKHSFLKEQKVAQKQFNQILKW